MDYWSVLASVGFGMIVCFSLVMQILCVTSLFCLETTVLPFGLYTCHHYQSLNCSCHDGDIGDEAAERVLLCLYWAVLEWTGPLFVWDTYHVVNPVLPLAFRSSRQLPSSAPRWTMKRGAVITDFYWAVFCLLTPQTPHHHPCHCHYLPLPTSFAPFLRQSQALSSQTLEQDFLIDTGQQ